MPTARAASKKVAPPALKPGSYNGPKDLELASDASSSLARFVIAHAASYGFGRVHVPVVEEEATLQALWKDTAGGLDHIAWVTAGAKRFAVRPHVAPSILRAYVQYEVGTREPQGKFLGLDQVLSVTPSGAVQVAYQFAFEVIGTAVLPLAEAQAIIAFWELTQALGLEGVTLEVNAVGDAATQASYQAELKDYLKDKRYDLCDSCQDHYGSHTWEILRCTSSQCQLALADAPSVLDHLDAKSKQQFTSLLEILDELGLPYQLSPLQVGPAGGSRTAIVFKYRHNDQTIILAEGVGQDNWLKSLHAKGLSAFGLTGTMGNLEAAVALSEKPVPHVRTPDIFLVPLGELAARKSLRLFRDLLAAQISVHDHFGTLGVKNQLKLAEERHAPLALIMGQKEAMDEMVILRDVKSGMQELFSYDKIVVEVKKRLDR
jgi:histidyl-tRNA synthetase